MNSNIFEGMHFNHWQMRDSRSPHEAFVWLHGFPGRFSRNEDLAWNMSARYGVASFMPSYPGLGVSPGSFSFVRSIEITSKWLQYLKSEFAIQRFHLIGHSFGGLVACNLWKSDPAAIASIHFLAPLLRMISAELIRPTLEGFVQIQNAFVDREVSLEDLLGESEILRDHYDPQSIFEAMVERELVAPILHGVADNVIPVAASRSFAAMFPRQVQLIELQEDHRLARNRNLVIDTLAQCLEPYFQ